jgi:hypothetical protein
MKSPGQTMTQKEFNRFVHEYNEAYVELLTRASASDYHGLLSSFIPLEDLLGMIRVMHDTLKYTYQVLPYPFPFRDNERFLRVLGFSKSQIRNIFEFLNHVQTTQGESFETCLVRR